MDRSGFLKGMLCSGIIVTGSDDLFSKKLHTRKTENHDRPDVGSSGKVQKTIKLIGIGGCGINVINAAIKNGLQNVDFIAIDTDAEYLKFSNAEKLIHINSFMACMIQEPFYEPVTEDEAIHCFAGKKIIAPYADMIRSFIGGAGKVFIVAGLGGETSTILAPVIAEMAHASGAATTAIVTFPFAFEGLRRHCIAEDCSASMEKQYYNTVLIVNDQFVNKKETLLRYFSRCDQHIVKVIENGIL